MKCVLEANKENIISTFEKDSIGRNKDIFHFVRHLFKINGPYSVAIDGKWGSGKTFFVKQTKMILDALNPFTQVEHELTEEDIYYISSEWKSFDKDKTEINTNKHICVYFDAWEYDFDEEPVLSLIYQISKVASSAYKFEGERNYLDIASSFVDFFGIFNSNQLLRSLVATNPTDKVKGTIELQETINKYFDNLLPEQGERLVIFIDELDRCNPAYAVKLLERIKHYFTNDKITFVFSVNLDQLQHTVKQHYGQDFDGYGYLDRFFDLTLPMPKLDVNKFYKSIKYDTVHSFPFAISKIMIDRYNMSMRTILHYQDEIRSRYETIVMTDTYTASKRFCHLFVLPVIIGLKQVDYSLYTDFISGRCCDPLIDVILTDKELLDTLYCSYYNGKDFDFSKVEADTTEWTKQVYESLFLNSTEITIGNIRVNSYLKEYMKKLMTDLAEITDCSSN